MKYEKAIRMLRASRGLEQKELAAKLDVDPSYVSLLERGKRAPSTELLDRLSKVFNVPVYLLCLLASEDEDLRGIDAKAAGIIGQQLLSLVTESGRTKRGA